MAVQTDLNLQVNLNGKNSLGPLTPIGVNVPVLAQGAYDRIEVNVPSSGPPIVVTMPPIGAQQAFFMLVSDLPCGVQLNAEPPLTPGAAINVLPAVVLRTGGPTITTVTLTPGPTPATVVILVAGK